MPKPTNVPGLLAIRRDWSSRQYRFADIDKDGFIEFLVSANNQLDLYVVMDSCCELHDAVVRPAHGSIDNSADAPRNIAVAGETGLTLLDRRRPIVVEPTRY